MWWGALPRRRLFVCVCASLRSDLAGVRKSWEPSVLHAALVADLQGVLQTTLFLRGTCRGFELGNMWLKGN